MKIYEEIYNDTLSAEILAILNGAGTEDEKIQAILDAADKDYNLITTYYLLEKEVL